MKKIKVKCINGPLDGEVLYLAEPSTATFTMKGQHGRYIPATVAHRHVKWEASHASRA